MVPADLLASLPLFVGLERTHLDALSSITVSRTFDRGQTVFREGEPMPPYFFILVVGTLQIVKSAASGKETVLRLIRPGEPFGWAALLDEGETPAAARAMTSCRVVMIPRDDLLAMLAKEPKLALRLLAVFGERLRDVHEQLHSVVSERARTRLARLILRYEQREGPSLATPLPHQVLARMAGITYEESVRILGEWTQSARPVIDYGRGGKIVVLDERALVEMADGLEEPLRKTVS